MSLYFNLSHTRTCSIIIKIIIINIQLDCSLIATKSNSLSLERSIIASLVPACICSIILLINGIVSITVISPSRALSIGWLILLARWVLLLIYLCRASACHQATKGPLALTWTSHPIIVEHALELTVRLESKVNCEHIEHCKDHYKYNAECFHTTCKE